MTEKTQAQIIREEKNAYMREYRKKNRKKIAAYEKKWRDENPEKVAQANQRHWLKKAEEREKQAN